MSDPRRDTGPDTDPHTGHAEVDPVTGYETTGHDWNGIRELNTPFPKIVIAALVLTLAYSVVTWVFLPAWPLGRDYTRGLLGLDQGELAVESFREMNAMRQDWLANFDTPNFAAIAENEALMASAMPAADRLYSDNCAACHGPQGNGGPGFPVLRDDSWLWGGDAEVIAQTIRVGINDAHPDTRIAQMPAFDWMSREERQEVANYVETLREGSADHNGDGATLFAENCAACHGERGVGGLETGAPSLADDATIHGQDSGTVLEILRQGRQGHMPAWDGRLSDAEINLLALYVSQLGTPPLEARK